MLSIVYKVLCSMLLLLWAGTTRRKPVKDSLDKKNDYIKYLPFSNKFLECMAICDAEKYNEKEKIYQHDEFGANDTYISSGGITACNVYDFGSKETLKEVTIGTESKGCKYRVYYTNKFNGTIPSSKEDDWQEIRSGIIPHNGYFTCKLKNEVKLKGEKGAVIVKIESNEESGNIPIIKAAKNSSELKITPKDNSSFILRDDGFVDINKDSSGSFLNSVGIFSIKARTVAD